MIKILFSILALFITLCTEAQVGDYRNKFSIGLNGGYALNSVNFQPTVTQSIHGGATMGLTLRYTSEKYFSTLCALQMEVNYTRLGWKQQIRTINETAVINPETNMAEEYSRSQDYIQIPFFAHLSWGKEQNGVNAFINLGPQIGINIGEHTNKNYNEPYLSSESSNGRINIITEQESMPIENKFDYGIAGGAGIEFHYRHFGRLNIEGRYYYGLGNIYGDSKRDFFGSSNHNTITIKMTYLHDF